MVSNFDTRLRRILHELDVEPLFDAVVISAEVRGPRAACHLRASSGKQWGRMAA